MTAAVIGFIGVIAGAFLTGWLTHRVEKRRRRAEARVAAHLIAGELDNAAIEVASSLQTNKWWSGELLTDQWKENASALAMEANPELLEDLVDTYALLESWDRDRKEAESSTPDADSEKLEEDQEQFELLAGQLKRAMEPPTTSQAVRVAAFVAMSVAALVIIGAFVHAAVAPRTETTNATIAAALEKELPGQETVYCSHNADRWNCGVSYPNSNHGSCRVDVPRSSSASVLAERSTSPRKGSCGRSTAEKLPTSYEVVEGDEGPVAIQRAPRAADAARKKHRERIRSRKSFEISVSKRSIADRVGGWFEGDQ